MAQYSSEIEYNRAAETERRIAHNRKIDAIVKKSLEAINCECGSSLKQKKRGSYIVICIDCKEEFKLID